MSLHAVAWAKAITEGPNGETLTRSEKLALIILADFHNPAHHCAWPSMRTIATHALLSERRARSVVHSLQEKGLVRIQHVRLADGDNAPNRYFFPTLAPEGGTVAEPIPVDPEPSNDGAAAEPELDAAAVRSRVHAWLDTALDAAPGETIEVYRMAYDEVVPDAVTKYTDVKGVGLASLLNEVVFHAANRYGLDLDTTAVRRLAGMRRDHGFAVIELIPEALQRASGDPLAYLLGMAKKASDE